MYKVERREGTIPSIRMSSKLIAELVTEIHETSKKTLPSPSLSVQIVEPKRIRSYFSVDEFRPLALPPRINGIGIYVGDPHDDPEAEFSARIDFGFLEPLESKYEFYGPDEKDMNGLEATLKDRWNQHRTWNFLVHKRPWQDGILALTLLGILLGIGRVLTRLGGLRFEAGVSNDYLLLVLIGGAVFLVLWAPLRKFIKWMFPYFSYPEDASTRKRKWIMKGIGIAIALASLSDVIVWMLFG